MKKNMKKKEKIERDIKKRKRERDRHGDGIREEDRKYKHQYGTSCKVKMQR